MSHPMKVWSTIVLRDNPLGITRHLKVFSHQNGTLESLYTIMRGFMFKVFNYVKFDFIV